MCHFSLADWILRLRMVLSENRFPFFGVMRYAPFFRMRNMKRPGSVF
jgi:hypothetical protein